MDITGVVVSYKTTGLLKQAIESIRSFYPHFNIIIIDGSPCKSDCYEYVKSLPDDHTAIYQPQINIGHGNGMHVGIEMATTEKILLFDSDIIMNKPCIEEMFEVFERDTYGSGLILPKWRLTERSRQMRYLHPQFMALSRKQYFKHHKFVHHGAPCYLTFGNIKMPDAKKILIEFPIHDYIKHLGRGTRALSPKEFKPKTWVH